MDDDQRSSAAALTQLLRADPSLAERALADPAGVAAQLQLDDDTAARLSDAATRAREMSRRNALMKRARDAAEGEDEAFKAWSSDELSELAEAARRLVEMTRSRSDEELSGWGGRPEEWAERFRRLRDVNRQWAALAAAEVTRRGLPVHDAALRDLHALGET